MTVQEQVKKPKSGKKGKSELKAWRVFAAESYRTQAAQLVTHSFKGVNTNISPGGGVRVIPSFDPKFPYACVRHGRKAVGLTYSRNATESAITEQICAVMDDGIGAGVGQYDNVPSGDRAIILEHVAPILHQQAVDAPDFVNPRLRQILVDDGSGADLCLTPLPSGGMSFRIKRLMKSILDRRAQGMTNGTSMPLGVDWAVVKVGGDKPQNAGRLTLISAMQNVCRFSVPLGTDDSMRQAFAIHYRGIDMTPNRKLVRDYGRWLSALRAADAGAPDDTSGGGKIRRTTPRIEEESAFIAAIVKDVLERGEKAREILTPYLGRALDTLTHEKLDSTIRGLIDPDLRDEAWKTNFARAFARRIYDVTDRNHVRLAGISGRSAQSLETYILEALA